MLRSVIGASALRRSLRTSPKCIYRGLSLFTNPTYSEPRSLAQTRAHTHSRTSLSLRSCPQQSIVVGFCKRSVQTEAEVEEKDVPAKQSKKPASPPEKKATAATATEDIQKAIKETAPDDVFAVVHVGGSQYKVTAGDVIVTQTVSAEVGSRIYLEKVLCAGGRNFSLVGAPLLDKSVVRVEAVVTEHSKTEKMVVFKMKRKKNYKRWNGHRQNISTLRIMGIDVKGI
ncbi:hypothetical protein SARC_01239 [Sphaeroforma arctica JP610]|uniref:Large ribosomal subunit protein bL21m n=1 Tax=Sphaeroforma arctica JP610 TaxID=667725 RepID=A0A0L0GC98_9EUKA|nr:hypothetical protein SARC_01239 [Sphaeroforma arctica JP610]KNC86610.1 hypothetical protein SARC_01239 [Sphaeroforma arctica JP610]|eukprot:XP_014160512.1 hypothetical protein SARC_01239 [Sphaeroforma arctica JP610]